MTWTQNFTPITDNLVLSSIAALIPILYFFWALTIKRMKGYFAGITTLLVALAVAVLIYGMPAGKAVMSASQGAVYGLLPIGWIIITSVFLYKMTVRSGQFNIIRSSVLSLTEDRRLQALLVAFSFGAFLEGAAGFGAPVAISAALLVGLGFNPLYAAGLCLIANTAPVAFGAVGIPINRHGRPNWHSCHGNLKNGRPSIAIPFGFHPALSHFDNDRVEKVARSLASHFGFWIFLCHHPILKFKFPWA